MKSLQELGLSAGCLVAGHHRGGLLVGIVRGETDHLVKVESVSERDYGQLLSLRKSGPLCKLAAVDLDGAYYQSALGERGLRRAREALGLPEPARRAGSFSSFEVVWVDSKQLLAAVEWGRPDRAVILVGVKLHEAVAERFNRESRVHYSWALGREVADAKLLAAMIAASEYIR